MESQYETYPEKDFSQSDEPQTKTTFEKRESQPVIKEQIFRKQLREVQPIIYREREKTELEHISKPSFERQEDPTTVTEKVLPQKHLVIKYPSEDFQRDYSKQKQRYRSSVSREPIETEVIEREPIIKEHITRKRIEEIQPIIYREVVQPHIIKEVKPIYETIVERPSVRQNILETVHHEKFAERQTKKQFSHTQLVTPQQEEYRINQRPQYIFKGPKETTVARRSSRSQEIPQQSDYLPIDRKEWSEISTQKGRKYLNRQSSETELVFRPQHSVAENPPRRYVLQKPSYYVDEYS